MKTPFLNNQNIQIVDLAGHFAVSPDSYFLVYAPLAGVFFITDLDTVNKLEAETKTPGSNVDVHPMLMQLLEQTTEFENRIIRHPKDYDSMSILPNLICNLHCSYCYSANGRSTLQLDRDTLKSALDFFINRDRVKVPHLSLFISGGGEPLISWELVEYAIKYSRTRAAEHGFLLDIMLMTNATLITPEIAAVLRQYDINVGVSFEIIKDIQNLQRGKFEMVDASIRTLLKAGVEPSISSVITPSNVDRMEEMADIVIEHYKGVRHLNFDPAMSVNLYHSEKKLNDFYDRFLLHFFKVKRKYGKYGITLDCNVIRKAEKLFPRYCQGKLALTPEGKISICHTISSPLESAYESAIYGEIMKDGRIIFDVDKFSGLINPDNFLMDKCNECIARWHCAGGCLMYRNNYNKAYINSVCRFTSKSITEILLRRLDNAYMENEGIGLEEVLNAKKLID